MTQQNNELATVNTQTGEISTHVSNERLSADGRFLLYVDETGKHRRKMIYKEFASVTPETREEKVAFFNLLNDEESATPMKDAIGTEIVIRDVILQPYDRINEETGAEEYGVVTYIIGQNDEAFVTSSKSVYNSLQNLFTTFGKPSYSADFAPVVKIISQAGQTKGRTIVNLKLVR